MIESKDEVTNQSNQVYVNANLDRLSIEVAKSQDLVWHDAMLRDALLCYAQVR